AGLAGAAVAASLARRGWQVEVLDAAAEPANGASGLPAGLMAPHLSPDDNLLSRLSRSGIRITLDAAAEHLRDGLDWQAQGTLEHRLKPGARPLISEGFAADWSRAALPQEVASAGLPAQAPCVWHAHAGWIRPAALVRAWLGQPGIRFRGGLNVDRLALGAEGWRLLDADGHLLAQAPLVVLAAALGSAPLAGGRLWLHAVRGQVSWAAREDSAVLPPVPVNGNGHLLPDVPMGGVRAWITGSTYGRGETDTTVREADHAANFERMKALLPWAAQPLTSAFVAGQVQGWAGVRCASTDRRPLVGELEPGLWVSTAMGSRGLTFAALCAELLAARLHGEPLPLPASMAAALDVKRQKAPAR
ncbi:MAG: FAD-dependent 5-carboxymethylaminomethyl-2-thiouridine(34) oxidoreductase MnmC, partial [Pseudomonadota bacterium]